MKTIILDTVGERANGWTHIFKIPYTDLTDTAGTSKAIALLPYAPGDLIRDAAFYLKQTFDGGSTSALALDVGHNGGTTDDVDSLLDNYEIHEDASEIKAGDANGAAFATLRTGYAPQDSGNIEATFTATGANLSTLTQGEVWIYLNVCRLPSLG